MESLNQQPILAQLARRPHSPRRSARFSLEGHVAQTSLQLTSMKSQAPRLHTSSLPSFHVSQSANSQTAAGHRHQPAVGAAESKMNQRKQPVSTGIREQSSKFFSNPTPRCRNKCFSCLYGWLGSTASKLTR